MPAVIQVEQDREGLHLAVRALFEEALIRERQAPLRAKVDAETRDRLDEDIPERELAHGYYLRASYLLDLSNTLQLGVPVDPASITRADVVGLGAVRSARAEYETDHPACPACGLRQDNRWMKECFSCHAKFAGRGN